MRLEVTKCYELVSDGESKRFRVIKNAKDNRLTIRYCETGEEEEFYTETAEGGFSEDWSIEEIDCEDCDGKPSS